MYVIAIRVQLSTHFYLAQFLYRALDCIKYDTHFQFVWSKEILYLPRIQFILISTIKIHVLL